MQQRLSVGERLAGGVDVAGQQVGSCQRRQRYGLPAGTVDAAAPLHAPPRVLAGQVDLAAVGQPGSQKRVRSGQVKADPGVFADRHHLLKQPPPLLQRPPGADRPTDEGQDVGMRGVVPEPCGQRHCLVGVGGDLFAPRQPRQDARGCAHPEAQHQSGLRLDHARRTDRPVGDAVRARQPATPEHHQCSGEQPAGPIRVAGGGGVQRSVQPALHLYVPAPVEPEPQRRLGDVQHRQRTARVDPPRHRRAEVGDVGGQPRRPRLPVGAGQTGADPLGQGDVVVEVAVAHPRRVVELVQPLLREHPDRLQQPVARHPVVLADLHQRVVSQGVHQVEHCRLLNVGPGHHCPRRLQIEGAGEHRQPCQRQPLSVTQ